MKIQSILFFMYFFFCTFCNKKQLEQKTNTEIKKSQVYVEEVKKIEQSALITMAGPVRAKNERQIFSPVSGVVQRVWKNPGDLIKKGESLFSLSRESQGGETFLSHPLSSDISGTFLRLYVKTGDRVTPGTPIGSVGDGKILWIEARATYQDLKILQMPTRIKVYVSDIGQDALGEAKLAFIEPSADPKTGTFAVSFEMPCHDCSLKPGMIAKIFIESDIQKIVLLEDKAIYRREQENYVLTVDGAKAIKTIVTLGQDQGNGKTQILEGLSEGQKIITSWSKPVQDGDEVQIVLSSK